VSWGIRARYLFNLALTATAAEKQIVPASQAQRKPADSKEKPRQEVAGEQAAPRESLRYDGKTFVDWAGILKSDLNPVRRLEAIKALGQFGTRGYAQRSSTADRAGPEGLSVLWVHAVFPSHGCSREPITKRR
jgi:hypothetical protein